MHVFPLSFPVPSFLFYLPLLFFSFVSGHHEEKGEVEEESHLNSTGRPQTTQKHGDAEANNISTSDKHGSGRPESSLRSRSNQRSSRRSAASPCEGMGPASGVGLTSVHGRLSSCSTVMVTDEQLVLNPVNQEVGRKQSHIQ